MKTAHPNDGQLEQYRKQRLTPEQKQVIAAHAESCLLCSRRIEDMERLELLLDSAAADALSGEFTPRLMEKLSAQQQMPVQPKPVLSRKRRMALRSELVNILVAASATYLFVASGAFKVVVALDQASLEIHVFSRLGAALQVVGQWIGSFN